VRVGLALPSLLPSRPAGGSKLDDLSIIVDS
jgi:hypothetical protein